MQNDKKNTPAPKTHFVRLKPYDPRRGQVIQRYIFRGIKFLGDRGWYRVDAEVAEALRPLHQIYTDDRSPLAFDVCTEQEAKALDEKEGNPRQAADQDLKLSVPREDAADSDPSAEEA